MRPAAARVSTVTVRAAGAFAPADCAQAATVSTAATNTGIKFFMGENYTASRRTAQYR